ncbi:uncharacterized protein LOC110857679 [Folsomia candida]|uniref:Apolipoprotein D n=1 Tax=Folsomia candida TaxID=158441 RepID=A0A226DI08_FOLCA|nr:uncharacterized protein LOC110857679 [Folsomia candida]OXA44598.1 hypothetical protein Fcan01_20581 [Folsomia candida]
MKTTIALLLVAFAGIQAQIGIPCHSNIFNFTPRHNLNISRYAGTWYVQEVGSSNIGNFPQPDWKCEKHVYSAPTETDPPTLSVLEVYVNITDGTTFSEDMPISVNATRSPMSAMWRKTSGVDGDLESQVFIMSADLEFATWTIMYSCAIHKPFFFRREVLMAMTRSRTIQPDLRSFLKALMVGGGFRIGDQWSIDQTGCTN